MEKKEKWFVIFVSAEERYGLATRVNDTLQLTCRGMVQPMARHLCEVLNSIEAGRQFETAYNG